MMNDEKLTNEEFIKELQFNGYSFNSISEIMATKEEYRSIFFDIGPGLSKNKCSELKNFFNKEDLVLSQNDKKVILDAFTAKKDAPVPKSDVILKDSLKFYYKACAYLPDDIDFVDNLFEKLQENDYTQSTFVSIVRLKSEGKDFSSCISWPKGSFNSYMQLEDDEREVLDKIMGTKPFTKTVINSFAYACIFLKKYEIGLDFLETFDEKEIKSFCSFLGYISFNQEYQIEEERKTEEQFVKFIKKNPSSDLLNFVLNVSSRRIPDDLKLIEKFVNENKTFLKDKTKICIKNDYEILVSDCVSDEYKELFIRNLQKYSDDEITNVSEYVQISRYSEIENLVVPKELFELSFNGEQKKIICKNLRKYSTHSVNKNILDYVSSVNTAAQLTEIENAIDLKCSDKALKKMADPTLSIEQIQKLIFCEQTGNKYENEEQFVLEANKRFKDLVGIFNGINTKHFEGFEISDMINFISFITEMNEKYNQHVDIYKCLNTDISLFFANEESMTKKIIEKAMKNNIPVIEFFDNKYEDFYAEDLETTLDNLIIASIQDKDER